jgi:flagellar motor switch protein FliG
MRISDLRERLTHSFGPEWAASFSADIALSSLGSLTVNEALTQGYEAQDIWRAVCDEHPTQTEKYKY